MLGDPVTGARTGMSIRNEYRFLATGGTNLAVALMAAITADALQRHGLLDAVTGRARRAGFLNPTLYRLARDPGRSLLGSGIADVVPVAAAVWTPKATTNRQDGGYLVDIDAHPQPLRSRAGWDPVTGIGTPTRGFLAAINDPARAGAIGTAIAPLSGQSVWRWLWTLLTRSAAPGQRLGRISSAPKFRPMVPIE
jgi:hypothetical protein